MSAESESTYNTWKIIPGEIPVQSWMSEDYKYLKVMCLELNGRRIFVPGNVISFDGTNVRFEDADWYHTTHPRLTGYIETAVIVDGNPFLDVEWFSQEVCDVILADGPMDHHSITIYQDSFPDIVELIRHCIDVGYDQQHMIKY